MAKEKEEKIVKSGKLSVADMRKALNKKAGVNVSYDLLQDSPTNVKEWIPTGSTWLDSIICRGKKAGIPVGKISEIAGLSSTGKSYIAAQIAANAQKMGITPVIFDSESAIDPAFLEKAGCDLDNLLYIIATSVEAVMENIEELLKTGTNKFLFIWDSLAMTPTVSDVEGDFNPNSSMAVKARVLSKSFSKLIIPIAESQSTFLVLNQLKQNIQPVDGAPRDSKYWTTIQKYNAPGGKSPVYAYSLRIWLTTPSGKDDFVNDDKGFRIGSSVKATLIKSRFGSQNRSCEFKILWGDTVGVLDDESLFEAIKSSPHLDCGAWNTLKYSDNTETKFRADDFVEQMKEPKFRTRVMELLDIEVIQKFDKREGDASQYYEVIPKQEKSSTQEEELAD